MSDPVLDRLLTFHVPDFTSTSFSLACLKRICPILGPFLTFHNKLIFMAKSLLPPCPTPKLQDHPLLDVHDCLFNSCYTYNGKNVSKQCPLNQPTAWCTQVSTAQVKFKLLHALRLLLKFTLIHISTCCKSGGIQLRLASVQQIMVRTLACKRHTILKFRWVEKVTI
jgi:hypothetical protein